MLVTRSCPILCNPTDCSPLGSSVHGILQARILSGLPFPSPTNAGDAKDLGVISGSGRSLGVGNGSPMQYSCLENPMDIGAWRATVLGVTDLDMTEHSTIMVTLQN